MMDWDGGMGAGWWVLMVLLWVVLVVAIVWAVAQLAPRGAGREREPREPDDAQEILDRRLARGEIDAETYATLRDTMRDARAMRG
jgi:putative membrane protein